MPPKNIEALPKFSGKLEDWFRWKNLVTNRLVLSGLYLVATDPNKAKVCQLANKTLWGLLSEALYSGERDIEFFMAKGTDIDSAKCEFNGNEFWKTTVDYYKSPEINWGSTIVGHLKPSMPSSSRKETMLWTSRLSTLAKCIS